MLARIAQELFWLGRDVTRAEHTARMLDGAFHADVAGAPLERGMALSWPGVLAIIGAKPPAPGPGTARDSASRDGADPAGGADPAAGADPAGRDAGEHQPEGRASPLERSEIAALLTLDTDSPASIVSCVSRARELARTLRDVISTEMWEALNAFYLSLERYELEIELAIGPYSVYQDVKERCALFWGLLERTMLHDEGRSFLEAGGRIEQADMVLRMLRVGVPAQIAQQTHAGHEAEAFALLQAVGGFQAYRGAVGQAPELKRVARFMLYEGAYPGSVTSSVTALRDALETADPSPRSSPPVLRLGRLIADLELQRRMPGSSGTLGEMFARVQEELELVEHDIDTRYFAIAAVAAVHL
ncbi:MAG: alpha-E domain-containing protein [Solirubrobacteraceae bacterium]